jgi:lysozyme family protein
MTSPNFPAVMAEIFKHEGGYVDHPADPGGATNMGITFATLKSWRGQPITKADVKALTKAEAEAIYRAKYWNPTKCDDLPAGIDLIMMDGSVNSGIGRGPKWVQSALGVTADGKVGPATIAAAKVADPVAVINAACDARLKFLRSLKTWPTFGKGWQRRVDDVRAVALRMASVKPAPAPTPKPIEDPPRIPPGQDKAWGVTVGLGAAILFIGALIWKGIGL